MSGVDEAPDWTPGQPVRVLTGGVKPPRPTERSCRVCGCTDNFACITDVGPCHWVDYDLCSACVDEAVPA